MPLMFKEKTINSTKLFVVVTVVVVNVGIIIQHLSPGPKPRLKHFRNICIGTEAHTYVG